MILLSNGTSIFETGSKDSRGYTLLIDNSGRLYTSQGGRIIAGGMATGNSIQFNEILTTLQNRGDDESAKLLNKLKDQFQASLPVKSAFKVAPISDFIEGARTEADDFFGIDRQLFEDKLKLVESQARSVKDLNIGQSKESLDAFVELKDRGFAQSLQKAQNGYASRETAGSGIAQRGFAEDLQANQDVVAGEQRQFSQLLSRENLSFSQLLEQQVLDKKFNDLKLDRDSEAKALAIAQANQKEQEIKDKALADSTDNFLS